MNQELPDVQAGFRKGRGTRDQIANICWIIKKAREFQKNIYFCFIDYPKPSIVWITINCGTMLSKSLIQFFVGGWGYVSSLLFDLRNYGGGNEDYVDLLQKFPA